MEKTVVIIFIMALPLISSADKTAPNLCSNTKITAADRLPNNTILIYRNDYYWELTGLPGKSGQAKGPYKVWYQHMAPVSGGTSVQTVLSGDNIWLTYKITGKRYWIYNSETGKLVVGGKAGYTSEVLTTSGCQAALSDGGMAGKGVPLMICFDGSTIRYYNMNERELRRYGKAKIGGAYGEMFPGDITAAFAYPSDDPTAKFNVYLFQNKKYCFRPYIGEDGCKQWKDNSELFGCGGKSVNAPEPAEPQPTEPQPAEPQVAEPQVEKEEIETTTKQSSGCVGMVWIESVLMFALLLNILIIF